MWLSLGRYHILASRVSAAAYCYTEQIQIFIIDRESVGDADTAIFYFTEKDDFCNNQMSLPLTQKIKINNLV